ncbi:hypothetical protein HanIR_Chr02g0091801 [Helianthus annuus]|nr:hypothetical protein HanIR_Chr02g0091801 [Helianthus annuus]
MFVSRSYPIFFITSIISEHPPITVTAPLRQHHNQPPYQTSSNRSLSHTITNNQHLRKVRV